MFNLAKLREERAKNGDEGFTLIELLVVVVIIGILIAIAIPLYLNYKKGANNKSAQSDLRGAVTTLEQCNSDNTGYPSGIGTEATGTNFYPLGSGVGCANATINVSSGTTLTYAAYAADHTTSCTTAPCASFSLSSTNSGGTGKNYSYQSWVGGSVN